MLRQIPVDVGGDRGAVRHRAVGVPVHEVGHPEPDQDAGLQSGEVATRRRPRPTRAAQEVMEHLGGTVIEAVQQQLGHVCSLIDVGCAHVTLDQIVGIVVLQRRFERVVAPHRLVGFLDAAQLVQHRAEAVPGLIVFGNRFDHPAIALGCLLDAPQPVQLVGGHQLEGGVAREQRGRLAIERERVVDATGRQQRIGVLDQLIGPRLCIHAHQESTPDERRVRRARASSADRGSGGRSCDTAVMTPYEAIVSKRDLRMYTDQAIPDDVMQRILQAGRMAGSAKNIEANRLIVVTDQAVQDALAGAGDFASWIGSSAAVIGFASPVDQLRLFDVGRQAQNMMIAAHAEGVGTCPVTLGHADKARAAVGLPDDWVMPMVITLGYPVANHPDSPLKRPRVALDELVRRDRWS